MNANPLWARVAKQGLLNAGNYVKGNTRGKLLVMQCHQKNGFKGLSAIVKLKVIESKSKQEGFPPHEPGDKVSVVKGLNGDQKAVTMTAKTLNTLVTASVAGDPDVKEMPGDEELSQILSASFAEQAANGSWSTGDQFLRGFIVNYDTTLSTKDGKDRYFPKFETAPGENTPAKVQARRAELDKTDPIVFE